MQSHRENREAPNWRVWKNVVLVGIHRDGKQVLSKDMYFLIENFK